MEPDRPGTKKAPSCPCCGNRLRLRPDQIGSEVMCPKCSSTFVVGRKHHQVPATSGDSDDAYEPEIPLVPSSIVPIDEMIDVRTEPTGQPQYEADWSVDELEAEDHHERPPGIEQDYLALAEVKGLMRTEFVPPPPRWTFFSGVFTFPWQGFNIGRWGGMTFGLSMTGCAFIFTLDLLGFLHGKMSNSAVMGVPAALVTIGLALITCSFCAASVLAAIQDTADGHDEVQETSMPDWDQWTFTFISMFSLAAAAGAIGLPLSLIEPIGPAAFLISTLIFFPILLLSAMETDSFFMPYSPPVLSTLRRYWHGWLLFYLLTTMMLLAWCIAFGFVFIVAPYAAMILSGPVLGAMMLIYARWLGRLAWRASGAPAAAIEDVSEPSGGDMESKKTGSSKHAKKRQRIRIQLPDFDAVAGMVSDQPPAARPRIDFHRRG